MRKFVLLSAMVPMLLLGTAVPAQGQFGIRGGISLNDFFGDEVSNTEQSRNLSYGISVGLIRIGSFQIMAEGYYRQKGAGWSALDVLGAGGGPVALDSAQIAGMVNGADLSGQMLEFGLDYIEVPVLLRWNLPIFAGRLRPYLNGGPAFGWRVDCGVTVSLTAAAASEEPEADCQDLTSDNLQDTLKDYELGMVVGGGLDVGVLGGMGAITLDFRLTRGLSRISEGQTGPEVRNQAFSAVLGYTFGFF